MKTFCDKTCSQNVSHSWSAAPAAGLLVGADNVLAGRSGAAAGLAGLADAGSLPGMGARAAATLPELPSRGALA